MTGGAAAESYLRKAKRALDEARILLREGSTEGTCNRAQGVQPPATTSKTHHGLIADFGRRLILTGLLESSLGRDLNRVQTVRLAADYSCELPPLKEAREAVERAERFVAAIQTLIRSGGVEASER